MILAYLFFTALSGWWVASVVGECLGSTVYKNTMIIDDEIITCTVIVQ